jgi:hypothetical protein
MMISELKKIEEIVRSVQEKAHKSNEIINTLPPAERMMTILANRHVYSETE